MIVPQNEYVLCKKLNPDKKEVSFGNNFSYIADDLPIYQIISFGKGNRDIIEDLDLHKNSKIIINSTGTKVIEDDQEYYLVKFENIAAKIKE